LELLRVVSALLLISAPLGRTSHAQTQVQAQPAPAGQAAVAAPFQGQIDAFLKEDETTPPLKGEILFIGSSIFRNWKNLKSQMEPLPVFNRAFGGSRTWDVLYHMDRIVLPYEPRIIVYYCGSNDVNAGEKAEPIFARFREFVERVQRKLPQTRVFYVSINRAPQKKDRWDIVDAANSLVKEYCSQSDTLGFIDVNPVLFDEEGNPRLDLYLPDQLHLREPAYEEFTRVIKPVIDAVWRALPPLAERDFSRWEKSIAAFETQDRDNPPPKDSILFAGSSSIRLWDLKESFPGLETINRGFGGSQIADTTHFADRIILKCEPRSIIFYAGDNDLNQGRSPEQVASDFRSFVAAIHKELPKTKIVFIGIKPSPARWKLLEPQKRANALIESYCNSDPRLVFIDTFPAMLGDDDLPRAGLFREDNLHLNARGYELWNSLIKPVLK
jgi:lysophospholipase L1-like esterase